MEMCEEINVFVTPTNSTSILQSLDQGVAFDY